MITKHVFRGLGAACVLTGACGLLAAPAGADAVSDFYRGKDIALIISTGPGGGMDQTARIVGRHWTKYLPGHPTFVAKNMPGAGHLRATNYLYNQAPKDGTAIASIIPSFVHHQLIGGKGTHYDAAKFEWLGSAITSNASFYVWHTSGVKTLQDAMKKIIIMGGTGAGSFTVLYPTILNNVLGTKFKIVMGYRHTGQVNLAMERGEVQGRAGNSFNTLMANNPQWVKEGKIKLTAMPNASPASPLAPARISPSPSTTSEVSPPESPSACSTLIPVAFCELSVSSTSGSDSERKPSRLKAGV